MPSYRAILSIGDVHPGHGPEAVMDAAVAAVSSMATVEQTDIQVLSNVPQIVVRFHIGDDANAHDVAGVMHDAVAEVATTGSARLLLRRGGRWLPI
ncbi:hypothetical protein [Yaniella halotolerans]|uniref:hypothetical protein n=1 Tax=Yaniella halotolerans TaxID=225453 RepID=UPI0003B6F592|nr:hypothetical protein [Yaniella halotolerans]